MGQGHKGELLGPTGLTAVKGKPRCCQTYQRLMCSAVPYITKSTITLPPLLTLHQLLPLLYRKKDLNPLGLFYTLLLMASPVMSP